MKVCSICGEEKSLDSFCTKNGNKSGKRAECKDCANDYQKEKRRKRRAQGLCRDCPSPAIPGEALCTNCKHGASERAKATGVCRYCPLPTVPGLSCCQKCQQKSRERRLKSRYGLTHQAFLNMLTAQASGCAVCGHNPYLAADKKGLVVDHNHTTGEVRALLCNRCNVALGLAEEDADRLRNLADYVDQHNR